jgi:hypothetical protein
VVRTVIAGLTLADRRIVILGQEESAMHESESGMARLFAVRVDDEDWSETRSLSGAGPEDNVFVVDRATGQVAFGDGTHGRRPSSDSVVTVTYRDGGGVEGDAQVSITTRWPTSDRRYLVVLSSAGFRISGAGGNLECFAGAKRLRYFFGQVLSVDDFREEQQYLIGRRHLHNLALHGWGVATGMSVTVSDDTSSQSVVIEPGLALDRHGREIELAAPVAVQLAIPGCSQYVIVEYAEKETDPVPSLADGALMAASRIEEGASIGLSHEAPTDDGVALARLVSDSMRWRVDSTFEPPKCRR